MNAGITIVRDEYGDLVGLSHEDRARVMETWPHSLKGAIGWSELLDFLWTAQAKGVPVSLRFDLPPLAD
jgi:hypothetical protein